MDFEKERLSGLLRGSLSFIINEIHLLQRVLIQIPYSIRNQTRP